MQLTATTLAERPALASAIAHLQEIGWSPFMLEDPVANRLWDYLGLAFPAYQFVLSDEAGTAVAYGNSIPFRWDGSLAGLPAGWDAVLERGVADYEAGRAPNTLSALAAVVDPLRRGAGLSAGVLGAMRRIAGANGLSALVAPVRPSLKSRYPLTPIEEYITWANSDGLPFDPWLRVHARLGARVLAVAPASMTVVGSVADWERWAGMRFPASGTYIVPDALAPISVDCERDQAIYIEPNVWMLHPPIALSPNHQEQPAMATAGPRDYG